MRFVLFFSVLAVSGWLRAGEQFPPAPTGQVTIRTLPAYTVFEAEETGSLEDAWTRGFRRGARYAAYANSALNTPILLTFPNWEKSPVATGGSVHLLVQLILDPLPNLPPLHDPGAGIVQMPAMTVACFSHPGAYTPENFQRCLQNIQDYLRAHNIASTGPPRYLYYTDTYWVPNWWRIGEVQVPIVPEANQN